MICCICTDTPGPVEGPIRFTGITAEKCTVWWNPPENDGCAAISHYVVEKRETSRLSWALVTSKCEACSYNVTNLIKGNEYQFRISAVNKFGVGKQLDSDPVIARMQYSELCYIKYILNCLQGTKKDFATHFFFFSSTPQLYRMHLVHQMQLM